MCTITNKRVITDTMCLLCNLMKAFIFGAWIFSFYSTNSTTKFSADSAAQCSPSLRHLPAEVNDDIRKVPRAVWREREMRHHAQILYPQGTRRENKTNVQSFSKILIVLYS